MSSHKKIQKLNLSCSNQKRRPNRPKHFYLPSLESNHWIHSMKNTKKCENNLNFGASVNFQCLQINSDPRTWQETCFHFEKGSLFRGGILAKRLAYFANCAQSIWIAVQRVCETAKKLVWRCKKCANCIDIDVVGLV